MKTVLLLAGCVLTLSLVPLTARADGESTAFEKALYDKARYQVLNKASDDDFASYCVTMNIGGDTLLKFHDEILEKQFELTKLQSEGFNDASPQVIAVNGELKDLRVQFAVKIFEARKGLEIEAKIADATLSALGQPQR